MFRYASPTCYFTKVGGYRVHDVKELTLDEYVHVWDGWGYYFYDTITGKSFKRSSFIADFWTLNPYKWLLGASTLAFTASATTFLILLIAIQNPWFVPGMTGSFILIFAPWLFYTLTLTEAGLRYDATSPAAPRTRIAYRGGYNVFVHVPFDHPQAAKYINENPEVSIGEGEYIFVTHATETPPLYSAKRMRSEEVYQRYLA